MSQESSDLHLRRTFRGSRDALLQRATDEPDLTWRVLSTLSAARILIAISLLVLFFAGSDPHVFSDRGSVGPRLVLENAGVS